MTHVLVVDDSAVDRRLAGNLLERESRWSIAYAADGVEALEQMARQLPDIVVTDVQMPRMDGLELVKAVRERYPRVPVMMMTAEGSEQLALQALAQGAVNYLPKSRFNQELLDAVDNVLAASRAGRDQDRLMETLHGTTWHFVLENDTSLIPSLVEQARNDLAHLHPGDQTTHTRMGIALHEAMMNAIHHGNLELSSDLRESDDRAYHDLARLRRTQDPFKHRRVYVTVQITREEARYVVRDEGPGFNPSKLPDPTDPSNLERVSGRGLLLIFTFMDEVKYNATGNEVTMIKRYSLKDE